jgi:hypothetical protein
VVEARASAARGVSGAEECVGSAAEFGGVRFGGEEAGEGVDGRWRGESSAEASLEIGGGDDSAKERGDGRGLDEIEEFFEADAKLVGECGEGNLGLEESGEDGVLDDGGEAGGGGGGARLIRLRDGGFGEGCSGGGLGVHAAKVRGRLGLARGKWGKDRNWRTKVSTGAKLTALVCMADWLDVGVMPQAGRCWSMRRWMRRRAMSMVRSRRATCWVT